jgi:hypothetical protein
LSYIHQKKQHDRLRREISELKAKIAELAPKQPEASKTTPEVAAEAKKPFDPWAPTGDVVFDALRSRAGQPRRRSWLND